MLQSMGYQRVRHNLATKQQQHYRGKEDFPEFKRITGLGECLGASMTNGICRWELSVDMVCQMCNKQGLLGFNISVLPHKASRLGIRII